MESLHAAINAGADAVYFGVGVLNMRARSSVNFTLDDLAEIVRIAHEAGVKTYLTVNTILYDNEMEDLRAIVDRAVKEGVDAIIAADVAAIMYARKVGMEVHISTQCNISNIEAVRFYAQWVFRVFWFPAFQVPPLILFSLVIQSSSGLSVRPRLSSF